VARNADGNRNLLRWARTGIVTPMYNSPTARDADIEAGVGRARDAIIADIEASHERLLGEASELPAESWQAVVRIAGTEAPASYVLYARLVELQVHHVDLAAAYSPAHWPAHFTERLLTTVVEQLNTRADSPALWLRADDSGQELAIHQESGAPRVHGPAPALLAWLIGRANGDGLAVDPRGALPRPPAWL
jgi:maleylpyruvate isomerase